MPRFLKLLIALFLAYAWTWSALLKDLRFIDDKWRLWILIGTTALFVLQQILEIYGTPADASMVEARREVICAYLNHLLDEYYTVIERHDQPPVIVRATLMLPTQKFKILRRLKIQYDAVPVGNPYSADERAMEFKRGEGACGRAWKQRDIVLYDATDQALETPAATLKKKKKELTDEIQSVLAVPVFKKHLVVGVLCLDSESPTNQTLFGVDDVCRLARAHADALAPFCFPNGVK